MNKRLLELAEQAGMTNDKFGMFFAKDKHNEDGVDLEKFVKLILDETKNVLLDMMDEGQGEFDTLDQALTEINEHFGVE